MDINIHQVVSVEVATEHFSRSKGHNHDFYNTRITITNDKGVQNIITIFGASKEAVTIVPEKASS